MREENHIKHYNTKHTGIGEGYYDNIAVCKTERELLELWKTKEPVTRSYVDKKQEKTVSINHKNVFISDGIVNTSYRTVQPYRSSKPEKERREIIVRLWGNRSICTCGQGRNQKTVKADCAGHHPVWFDIRCVKPRI